MPAPSVLRVVEVAVARSEDRVLEVAVRFAGAAAAARLPASGGAQGPAASQSAWRASTLLLHCCLSARQPLHL